MVLSQKQRELYSIKLNIELNHEEFRTLKVVGRIETDDIIIELNYDYDSSLQIDGKFKLLKLNYFYYNMLVTSCCAEFILNDMIINISLITPKLEL